MGNPSPLVADHGDVNTFSLESGPASDNNADHKFTLSHSSSTSWPTALPSPSSVQRHSHLPISLRLLFALNGATLTLPSLAIMSIINNRIAIPPAYLSAYGAIAFLPYSLKPCYAVASSFLSEYGVQRHALIAVLLALSGIAMGLTGFLPRNSVVLCFMLAFLRSLFVSWPEFLLGLALINSAKQNSDAADGETQEMNGFEGLASIYQSQAASCRNAGSLAADVVIFGLFAYRQFVLGDSIMQLSDGVVAGLCLVSGFLPLVGSFIAIKNSGGTFGGSSEFLNIQKSEGPSLCGARQNKTYGQYNEIGIAEVDSGLHPSVSDDHREDSVINIFSGKRKRDDEQRRRGGDQVNMAILVLFQVILIVCALRNPIVSVTSSLAWTGIAVVLAAFLMSIILYSTCYKSEQGVTSYVGQSQSDVTIDSTSPKIVALYLILRHATPTPTYILSSYMYILFMSTPIFLQILSVLGSAATTLSTWSYGKYFAKRFSSRIGMVVIICSMTLLSMFCSLLYIPIVRTSDVNGTVNIQPRVYLLVALISVINKFVGEWSFLPSIVLATTSVDTSEEFKSPNFHEIDDSALEDNKSEARRTGTGWCEPRSSGTLIEAMQYASFVSCIDFGDQIGDWVSVPLVSALGIKRENDWEHLDLLIGICALASFGSLIFLFLLHPNRTMVSCWKKCPAATTALR